MQKAYNPATGEVLFLVGDQWIKPSQVAQNPQTGEYAYLVNNNWELFKPPAPAAPATQQPVADETERLLSRFPAPSSSPTEDPMLRPEFIQAVERQLGSIPAEQRQVALDKLAQKGDVYGRAARVVKARFEAMDKAAPALPTISGVLDPRLEAQTKKLITEGGMEAQAAEAYARQELARGVIPRVLPKFERDIAGEQAAAEAERVKGELGDAGFASRVGAEVRSRLRQSALGAAQVYADVTGDKDLQSDLMRYRRIESARGEAIPKGEGVFEKSAQQAIATLTGQAPMILLSAMTGTALPVLGQAAFDSFTQSYGESRSAGKTPGEAATRAGLMATAEVLFERYGLTEQLKAVRGVVDRIPTDQLAGYLAKAFAKEVPAEQGTTLSNFLTDKLPQIGLAPDAGLKEYLEQAGETLRQTVLQSGASSATIYGAGKGIQTLLGPRATEEQFDVEALARSKGFLGGPLAGAPAPAPAPAPATPERIEPTFEVSAPAPAPAPAPGRIEPTFEAPAPAAPPAQPRITPGAPAPLSPEEIEAKVADYSRFMPEEDARRVVLEEQQKAAEAAEAEATAQVEATAKAAPAPELDPVSQRLKDLTQERIDAGVPPQQAALQALEQLQQEQQADEDAAKAAAEGEQRVAEPVTPPSGEGVGVAGVPSEQPPAGGVAGTERTGVVPTEADVGQPPAREGEQPGAVTPQVDQFEKQTADAEGQVAAYKDKDQPWRFTQRAVGQTVTFTDQGKTHTGTITAVEPVENVSGQGPSEILRVTDSDPTSGRDDAGNPAPEQWTLGNNAIQNVEAAPAPAPAPAAPKPTLRITKYADDRFGVDWLDRGGRPAFERSFKTEEEARTAATQSFANEPVAEGVFNWGTKEQETPTAAPAPAAPVVEAPKGKRGRKPLPPEEQAKSEERRKEQRREANAAAREVERIKANLATAKEAVEPGDYPNETEYSEAKISQGMRRKRALAALYDFSRKNRNKPGQEAKAALEAEATKQEIDDIAKGYEARKQAAKKVSPQQKDESRAAEAVNPKLKGVTTGLQAIGVLLRTGTIFQKLMAMRIRNSVRNVKIVILEKDSETPAELLTDAVAPYWESARALYVHDDATGTDTVYVRGESFGADQGLNNVTVLHELLHAATAQKLQLALRLMKKGLDSGAPVVKAAREIQDTMRAVADDFVRQNKAGTLPRPVAELWLRTGGAVITDVKEFVAYGLSDPAFQRYLNSITDVVEPSETFFSRFVDSIRALFGIPEDMHTAMTNLVNATDKLISSPKTERMRLLEEKDKKIAQVLGEKQRVSPQAKDERTLDDINKEVDEALLKFQLSKDAEQAAETIDLLHSLRRWKDFKRYFGSLYNTLTAEGLSKVLVPLSDDMVAAWGATKIPELKNTDNLLIDMRAMQQQLIEGAAEVSDNMVRAIKKDPSLLDKLPVVMSVATDVRVDPAVDNRNAKLSDLYNDLGTEGQRVYREVRDYYTRMVELYSSLLDAQIQEANLPPDAKKAIMAEIRRKFELDKKIVPYFPFTRNRGTYWLRVKKDGTTPSQFYMLGSIAERDAVAEMIAEKQNKTVGELFDDGVFKAGDSVETLRAADDTVGFSDKVKDIFAKIDNMASLGPKDKDAVKNSVYELYLATVPEQSFRNSFIERKDIAGYSPDVIRAFSTSTMRFASQLPRIKYGQKLRMSLLAGRKSLEGNKEQAKLGRFIEEMQKRVNAELNPTIKTGLVESAVNLLTRSAFFYYLSSASSAVTQMFGILYGASTVGARHGYVETAVEMGKMMRIFGEFSIIKKNPDGSVSVKPPSIALSKRVAASPMEQRVVREVFGVVTSTTYSSEVLGRGRVSTAKFEGRGSALGRGLATVTGGLFHTTERLAREVIFMASFRLSLKEGQKKGLKGDDLYNYAKRQATVDVYDSVGNMSDENRAPLFQNAPGRLFLQFMPFPFFITLRWMQEFKRMLPFMGNEAKFQAFKEFAGIMGTTYLVGGVVALPFIKELAGLIGAAFDDWDEEDKPAEMADMSYWTWWSTVWLPEYMGQVGVFGKPLTDLVGLNEKELAAVITRGPTNVLTGVDISSRVSINPTDMVMGSTKEVRTSKEGALQFAEERAGPAINMVLNYYDAYDAWQNGDTQRAIEKMLPAIARNVVIAEKFKEEGVKDYKGRYLITEDSYTKGDYLYQLIGFRPDNLSNHQKVLFEVAKGENKIRFERERLIRNARDATLKSDIGRLAKNTEERTKFNVRYPDYEIKQQDVDRSVDMSIEELLDSFKGFRPTDKNMRIFAPTAIASGRALEESQAKKKKKESE